MELQVLINNKRFNCKTVQSYPRFAKICHLLSQNWLSVKEVLAFVWLLIKSIEMRCMNG